VIAVDTNIIAYLYLPSDFSTLAEQLRTNEPVWVAPALWRSELRSVLALYLRKGMLSFQQAYAVQSEAETLMADAEYQIPSFEILSLVASSRCSAYDCEFVALARQLSINLITADKKILQEFPANAMALGDAIS
jgi:predicted nucleic acid-binding protein